VSKEFYVIRLIFRDYTTQPFRAELTEKQVQALRKTLEGKIGLGPFKAYQMGPPTQEEYVHALVLSAPALKAELLDLIETERRLGTDR